MNNILMGGVSPLIYETATISAITVSGSALLQAEMSRLLQADIEPSTRSDMLREWEKRLEAREAAITATQKDLMVRAATLNQREEAMAVQEKDLAARMQAMADLVARAQR